MIPPSDRSAAPTDMANHASFEKLYLMTFTRHPQEFETRLHEGPELEELRSAMQEADCSPRLASGATLLVYPEQYHAAKQTLAHLSLKHRHVAVSETFAPIVMDAIGALARSLKVRVRSMDILAYVDTAQDGDPFIVKHTFLDAPHTLRNPWSVTQSTGQVHRASNPRRRVHES